MQYRFVSPARDGTSAWAWRAHGCEGQPFASAHAAARDLARNLDVPMTALRKRAPSKVRKASSTPGVYWHVGKLGWVTRDGGGGAHISQTAAGTFVTRKRQSEPRQSEQRSHTLREMIRPKSRYRHVIFHTTKKAQFCAVGLKRVWVNVKVI